MFELMKKGNISLEDLLFNFLIWPSVIGGLLFGMYMMYMIFSMAAPSSPIAFLIPVFVVVIGSIITYVQYRKNAKTIQ